MTSTKEINSKSTMREVLEAYPSAKRALFTRYHIGGCSSCGFDSAETLEDVLKRKNVLDIQEVIEHIKNSQAVDDQMQIEPKELKTILKEGKIKLIDVRSPQEHGMAHIEGDLLAAEELTKEIMTQWPKDTPMVLYCHFGNISLEAAAYLVGHGFTQVKSLKGGIDAWSREADNLV